MYEATVAFFSQPLEAIARKGETFATEVIDILRQVLVQRRVEPVLEERNGVVVLTAPDARWNLVLIRHRSDHKVRADVWAVEWGAADIEHVMARYEPFVGIDRTRPSMEMFIEELRPSMFAVLAAANSIRRAPNHGFDPTVLRRLIRSGVSARRLALADRYVKEVGLMLVEAGDREGELRVRRRITQSHNPVLPARTPVTAADFSRWYEAHPLPDELGEIPSSPFEAIPPLLETDRA